MPSSPDTATLHRGFVTIQGAFGARQVHYRRGGRGPVVLLLHQSPQSSREMEPLIEAWGHAFTLLAPDSPGYGFSQPLQRAGQPVASATMEDFATATLEFVDALGVGRFGIYGFHTGASIGTALAWAHPDRVVAVAANGLVVLTEAERESILRDYLPPLVPRWDGGHLAWLWARMREQAIFFPWHDRRAATRMDFDVPPADRLQLGLLEFLAAGERYHIAYAAAFADRAERRLPAMRVPLLVTAQARDPLAGHLSRIGSRSGNVHVEASADTAAALARAFAHLKSHPGDAAPPPRATAPPGPALPGSAYLGSPRQQVRVLRPSARDASEPPAGCPTVILLHPPGGSAAALGALASDIAGHAAVLAPDLPGHGASDPPPAAGEAGGTLEGVVAQLAEALAPEVAAARTTVVVAVGASAGVASELARRLGPDASVLVLDPPSASAAETAEWLERGLPALTPVWSGGHLLEAWHMVRDGRLFSPWFRRVHAATRPGEPDLDDRRIHLDVSDYLRANGTWQALMRDVLLHRRRPSGTGEPPGIPHPGAPLNWAEVLRRAREGRGSAS
ncbi:MAG: alpha/beta fold hydrolase [Gammaproteobacteria bacterium]|nr:alpha/beta fold hydrolase [Gammaproteobacteria bacterium]